MQVLYSMLNVKVSVAKWPHLTFIHLTLSSVVVGSNLVQEDLSLFGLSC